MDSFAVKLRRWIAGAWEAAVLGLSYQYELVEDVTDAVKADMSRSLGTPFFPGVHT